MGRELESYRNTPEGAFWWKSDELIREDLEGYPPIEDEKLLRRELVQALRIENPCFTLQEIGDRAGITREAVRLILKDSDLETKGSSYGKNSRICEVYGRLFNKSYFSKTCSKACSKLKPKPSEVTVSCLQCGKIFKSDSSRVVIYPYNLKMNNLHKGEFCSRRCSSLYKAKQGIGFQKNWNLKRDS
jgi:hypothetical protein